MLRSELRRPKVAVVLVAGAATCLAAAMVTLPRDGAPLPDVARYAMEVALPKWHTTEPVNEIVYGTRGFDTFGETFLLLAAVMGVVVISRSKETRRTRLLEDVLAREEQAGLRRGAGGTGSGRASAAEQEERAEDGPGGGDHTKPPEEPHSRVGAREPERAAAMTVVVRGGIRTVAPVLAVAGIYLAAWGFSPGGGFPAGGVITGIILLAYVAYGHRAVSRIVRRNLLESLEMLGAAAIIGVELSGLVLKGSFSANTLPLGQVQSIRSGGILQAFSGSELVEVATGLTLVIFAFLSMGSDWAEEDEHQGQEGEQGR